MQVMRAKAKRLFRTKGFSPPGVAADPLGAAVVVGGSDEEVHRSTSGAGSLLYSRLTAAEFFLLLHTAAGFPLGLVVSMVAQPGHQHLHPQLDLGLPYSTNLF